MKGVRHLLGWQAAHRAPTVEDVRQGRAWFSGKGKVLEAVQLRPEDAKALGLSNVDGLPVESDGFVTPGMLFFVVAEGA